MFNVLFFSTEDNQPYISVPCSESKITSAVWGPLGEFVIAGHENGEINQFSSKVCAFMFFLILLLSHNFGLYTCNWVILVSASHYKCSCQKNENYHHLLTLHLFFILLDTKDDVMMNVANGWWNPLTFILFFSTT